MQHRRRWQVPTWMTNETVLLQLVCLRGCCVFLCPNANMVQEKRRAKTNKRARKLFFPAPSSAGRRTYWSPGSRCRFQCRRNWVCWSWLVEPWSVGESACLVWWCPCPPQGCSPGWLDPPLPPQGNIWTQRQNETRTVNALRKFAPEATLFTRFTSFLTASFWYILDRSSKISGIRGSQHETRLGHVE